MGLCEFMYVIDGVMMLCISICIMGFFRCGDVGC